MRKILLPVALVGLGVLVSAGGATAGGCDNTLAVTPDAAIDGNFGLQLTMNGCAEDKAYVAESDAHNSEVTHNIDFKINADGMTMDNFTAHTVHMSRQPGDNVIKVNLVRQNDQFKIVAFYQRENGNFKWAGKFTLNPATNQGRVQYEWVRASATGVADGQFRLIKGTSVQHEDLTADNFGNVVDVVRFGIAQGSDTTSSGTFDVDTYVATR